MDELLSDVWLKNRLERGRSLRVGKGQNRNKAEAYLKKIRDSDRALKSKRDELDALRYKASGAGAIRYDKDHVQTSPQDYLSMAMDDIIKIEKQIAEKEIVIEWYYLNGLSMIATADKMCIAERTAYYLRDDALETFGKMM